MILHSTVVSVPTQVTVGIAAGETAGAIVKALGGGEGIQRVARAAAHGVASGVTGAIINAGTLDPVAAGTVTPSVAMTGATAHYCGSLTDLVSS